MSEVSIQKRFCLLGTYPHVNWLEKLVRNQLEISLAYLMPLSANCAVKEDHQ
jgi:hypothetical protein